MSGETAVRFPGYGNGNETESGTSRNRLRRVFDRLVLGFGKPDKGGKGRTGRTSRRGLKLKESFGFGFGSGIGSGSGRGRGRGRGHVEIVVEKSEMREGGWESTVEEEEGEGEAEAEREGEGEAQCHIGHSEHHQQQRTTPTPCFSNLPAHIVCVIVDYVVHVDTPRVDVNGCPSRTRLKHHPTDMPLIHATSDDDVDEEDMLHLNSESKKDSHAHHAQSSTTHRRQQSWQISASQTAPTTPYTFCQLNRHLRSCVLSEPKLWNRIHVRVGRTSDGCHHEQHHHHVGGGPATGEENHLRLLGRLKFWLDQTGTEPLTIVFFSASLRDGTYHHYHHAPGASRRVGRGVVDNAMDAVRVRNSTQVGVVMVDGGGDMSMSGLDVGNPTTTTRRPRKLQKKASRGMQVAAVAGRVSTGDSADVPVALTRRSESMPGSGERRMVEKIFAILLSKSAQWKQVTFNVLWDMDGLEGVFSSTTTTTTSGAPTHPLAGKCRTSSSAQLVDFDNLHKLDITISSSSSTISSSEIQFQPLLSAPRLKQLVLRFPPPPTPSNCLTRSSSNRANKLIRSSKSVGVGLRLNPPQPPRLGPGIFRFARYPTVQWGTLSELEIRYGCRGQVSSVDVHEVLKVASQLERLVVVGSWIAGEGGYHHQMGMGMGDVDAERPGLAPFASSLKAMVLGRGAACLRELFCSVRFPLLEEFGIELVAGGGDARRRRKGLDEMGFVDPENKPRRRTFSLARSKESILPWGPKSGKKSHTFSPSLDHHGVNLCDSVSEEQEDWDVFALLFDKNPFNLASFSFSLFKPPASSSAEELPSVSNGQLVFETTLLHLVLSNRLKRLAFLTIFCPGADLRMLQSILVPQFNPYSSQEETENQHIGLALLWPRLNALVFQTRTLGRVEICLKREESDVDHEVDLMDDDDDDEEDDLDVTFSNWDH